MGRKRWEWLSQARLEYEKLPEQVKGVVSYHVFALAMGWRSSEDQRGRVEAYRVPLEQVRLLFYAATRDARGLMGLHVHDGTGVDEQSAGSGADPLEGGYGLAQARLTDSTR